MTYHVGIAEHLDTYKIAVHKTRGDMRRGQAEYHEAKDAEELLELLEGFYDPPLPWVAIPAGEEVYRRLGIVPGEEK